jgi:hypothetical protein
MNKLQKISVASGFIGALIMMLAPGTPIEVRLGGTLLGVLFLALGAGNFKLANWLAIGVNLLLLGYNFSQCIAEPEAALWAGIANLAYISMGVCGLFLGDKSRIFAGILGMLGGGFLVAAGKAHSLEPLSLWLTGIFFAVSGIAALLEGWQLYRNGGKAILILLLTAGAMGKALGQSVDSIPQMPMPKAVKAPRLAVGLLGDAGYYPVPYAPERRVPFALSATVIWLKGDILSVGAPFPRKDGFLFASFYKQVKAWQLGRFELLAGGFGAFGGFLTQENELLGSRLQAAPQIGVLGKPITSLPVRVFAAARPVVGEFHLDGSVTTSSAVDVSLRIPLGTSRFLAGILISQTYAHQAKRFGEPIVLIGIGRFF